MDAGQVAKAVDALKVWLGKKEESRESALFEDEGGPEACIHVMMALHKTPMQGDGKAAKPVDSNKPRRIAIPNPIFKHGEARVCVIVRDDDGGRHKADGTKPSGTAKQAKALVNAMEASAGISKVLGISKLRSKYKPHEAKRQLLNDYDVFVADDRILPLLPKLIGTHFFRRKKQPVPVNLVQREAANAPKRHPRSQEGAPYRTDWNKAIREVVESTFVVLRAGNCVSVRAADANQDRPIGREFRVADLVALEVEVRADRRQQTRDGVLRCALAREPHPASPRVRVVQCRRWSR